MKVDVEAETADDVSEPAGSEGAGSLERMLAILELFSEEAPVWATADIIEALKASRSTGYRYIKTLNDAGLIAPVRTGSYSLGPRIIEMDMQMRLSDPLLLASEGVLEELVDQIGHSALLCTSFRDAVLCVAEHRAPNNPRERFVRGQRRPLYQGAVSKVILAYLPHYRLKALYARQSEEIRKAGLGATWGEFRSALGEIKKNGYIITMGEFNPGVSGAAAPILTGDRIPVGSIGVAWDAKERRDVDVARAIDAVTKAAATVSERLKASDAAAGR